ncbi:acyl-CoA dehydrogenase family protein [Microbacterium trichothecenolyticum]|uniref:Acryloyl-CoA reductase (NADH) n=1 Tax=Microbacterium trichothecenolyticum TaxID=69370 RepID=A0A0M2HC96_MICTR|nr:acyl-CoA dehydrogenase family protein [Microbacterium trichothecenolyticum]KJL42313.1 Acryloyl-CoA reductase (NADH) [Microbacterium trichothecenolyticum]
MNEETEALVQAVADACERHPSTTDSSGGARFNGELWSALEQMGVTLLSVDEGSGGSGGDVQMTASVLAVLGEHSATVPYAETALLAGWMLAACGAPIPAGPLAAAVAGERFVLERDGEGWRIDGELSRVPWARHAAALVVLVGEHVVVVDRAMLDVSAGANLAGEPRDGVRLRGVVVVDAVRILPEGTEVTPEAFLARCALARAASISGAARRALTLSIKYAGEREQFGRTLKNFQAVQQHLAETAGEVLVCTAAAESAALHIDRDPRNIWPVAAASVAVRNAAGLIARLSHQVHGAIGFTDEHDLRLSTTRLWAWRDEAGSEPSWARRVGAEAVLAGPADLWEKIVG